MKETIIGGLQGEDLAAFLLMLSNGSSLESIQDEFGFSQSEVKSYSQAAREKAQAAGGIEVLMSAVDPRNDADTINNKAQKPNTTQPAPGIAKTSIGLRDALFKTMEDLMSGNIEAAEAVAVCGVSKAICETVKLEMEAERLMAATKGGKDMPRMLQLGEIAND